MPLEATSPSYSRGAFPAGVIEFYSDLRRAVEKLFNKGWKHREKAKPRVYAIFKVISPEGTLKPYIDYR